MILTQEFKMRTTVKSETDETTITFDIWISKPELFTDLGEQVFTQISKAGTLPTLILWGNELEKRNIKYSVDIRGNIFNWRYWDNKLTYKFWKIYNKLYGSENFKEKVLGKNDE